MRRKLQIFVSSTFTDLISERQAAVSAILKAGHIPAGMELFTAGDKSQMETIKRWIDESDAYMLILGGRYGSVEPTSGVSYTELEYDYAVEQSKPLFSVVIDDEYLESKVRSIGSSLLEKENPAQLSQFRKKVLSKISSFFKSDADIKLCVHESLADFRDNSDLRGWISASEYEDPKPLHDEISKLKSEIEKLRSQKIYRDSDAEIPDHKDDMDSIIEYLKKTLVKIPDNIRDQAGSNEINAFDLFNNNRDNLINGITNSANGNDVESFFYYNLAPKLILHGLMENEKIAGVRYRRSFVTPKGRAVLAEITRRSSAQKPAKSENASLAKIPKDKDS